MEKTITITEGFLSKDHHKDAIQALSDQEGKELEVGDVITYSTAECNGRTCPAGQICILGHCVDDDVPQES